MRFWYKQIEHALNAIVREVSKLTDDIDITIDEDK